MTRVYALHCHISNQIVTSVAVHRHQLSPRYDRISLEFMSTIQYQNDLLESPRELLTRLSIFNVHDAKICHALSNIELVLFHSMVMYR